MNVFHWYIFYYIFQVDEWWLDYGYHSNDAPLVPGTNFGGCWIGPTHPLRPYFHRGVLDEDKRAFTAGVLLRFEVEYVWF